MKPLSRWDAHYTAKSNGRLCRTKLLFATVLSSDTNPSPPSLPILQTSYCRNRWCVTGCSSLEATQCNRWIISSASPTPIRNSLFWISFLLWVLCVPSKIVLKFFIEKDPMLLPLADLFFIYVPALGYWQLFWLKKIETSMSLPVPQRKYMLLFLS